MAGGLLSECRRLLSTVQTTTKHKHNYHLIAYANMALGITRMGKQMDSSNKDVSHTLISFLHTGIFYKTMSIYILQVKSSIILPTLSASSTKVTLK